MIFYFNLLGEDLYCEVEYCVTYRGCPARMPSLNSPGEPAEAPEYEVRSMQLFRDVNKDHSNHGVPLDCPAWLSSLIQGNEAFNDAALEHIEAGDD